MNKVLGNILSGFAAAGAAAGLAACAGSLRWRRAVNEQTRRLRRCVRPLETVTVDFEDLRSLPEPVARYFRHVLREGRPVIRGARIGQSGVLRTSPERNESWKKFSAVQFIFPNSPGFTWNAAVRVNPLMKVYVRDSCVSGEGAAEVSAFGILTLARERGGVMLTTGALQRYLAEAVWCPTALLPSAGVQWKPLGAGCALAVLTCKRTTVSLEFHFGSDGMVERVYTPGRYRGGNGSYKLTPWEGRFQNYQETGGMVIPFLAEASWWLPEGRKPVWRGKISSVEYLFHKG